MYRKHGQGGSKRSLAGVLNRLPSAPHPHVWGVDFPFIPAFWRFCIDLNNTVESTLTHGLQAEMSKYFPAIDISPDQAMVELEEVPAPPAVLSFTLPGHALGYLSLRLMHLQWRVSRALRGLQKLPLELHLVVRRVEDCIDEIGDSLK